MLHLEDIMNYMELNSSTTIDGPECAAILEVCTRGEIFGYGNMMGWLSTAWAIQLINEGISREDAVKMVHGTPYPIPPKSEEV